MGRTRRRKRRSDASAGRAGGRPQLMAKLGDHRMRKHILRKRLKLNWKWGPLTSLSL